MWYFVILSYIYVLVRAWVLIHGTMLVVARHDGYMRVLLLLTGRPPASAAPPQPVHRHP